MDDGEVEPFGGRELESHVRRAPIWVWEGSLTSAEPPVMLSPSSTTFTLPLIKITRCGAPCPSRIACPGFCAWIVMSLVMYSMLG